MLLTNHGGFLQLDHERLHVLDIVPGGGQEAGPGVGLPPGVDQVQGAGDGVLPPPPGLPTHLDTQPRFPVLSGLPQHDHVPRSRHTLPELEVAQPQPQCV